MYVDQQATTITTATGGGATDYVPRIGTLSGRVASVQYIPGAGAAALASTADFTITSELTGESIWAEANLTAAKTVRPWRPVTSTSGITATNAALTEGVYLKNDRVKVVIAQGGNTKQGTFRVTVI